MQYIFIYIIYIYIYVYIYIYLYLESFSEMIKQSGRDKLGGDGKSFHCSGISITFHYNVSNIGKPASIYTLYVK